MVIMNATKAFWPSQKKVETYNFSDRNPTKDIPNYTLGNFQNIPTSGHPAQNKILK